MNKLAKYINTLTDIQGAKALELIKKLIN